MDSNPAITLSNALSKWTAVIIGLLSLTANMAASFAILDKWAPLKPWVFLAKSSKSTEGSRGYC